jgi:hypothetical protein
VERFSDCLRQLFRSISSEGSAELGLAAAVSGVFKPPVPAAVSSESVNSPAGRGADQQTFEVASPLAQTISSVSTVSGASTNVATGPPISSASSLPPAVLARIEANKQAALQKRKAAEDAAQRLNESVAISANCTLVTLPHDSGRPPSVDVLPPSLEQSGANQTKRTFKRHWGALGAVSDDGDD